MAESNNDVLSLVRRLQATVSKDVIWMQRPAPDFRERPINHSSPLSPHSLPSLVLWLARYGVDRSASRNMTSFSLPPCLLSPISVSLGVSLSRGYHIHLYLSTSRVPEKRTTGVTRLILIGI